MPPAILPAVIGVAGSLGASALASSGQRRAARTTEQALGEEQRIRREILDLIRPFATQLLNLGINPAEILSSPLGAALLSPGRQATSREFEQSRQNLVDLLGGAGFSPQSGIGAGPLANLFGQEALQQANLVQQLPLQAVQLGLQGANLLQGQQAQFNPQGTLAQLNALSSQPNFFQQSLANLPAVIAAAIAGANQPRPSGQTANTLPGVLPLNTINALSTALLSGGR